MDFNVSFTVVNSLRPFEKHRRHRWTPGACNLTSHLSQRCRTCRVLRREIAIWTLPDRLTSTQQLISSRAWFIGSKACGQRIGHTIRAPSVSAWEFVRMTPFSHKRRRRIGLGFGQPQSPWPHTFKTRYANQPTFQRLLSLCGTGQFAGQP